MVSRSPYLDKVLVRSWQQSSSWILEFENLARAAVSRYLLTFIKSAYMYIHDNVKDLRIKFCSYSFRVQCSTSRDWLAKLRLWCSFMRVIGWLNMDRPLIVWGKQIHLRFLMVFNNQSLKLKRFLFLFLLLTVMVFFPKLLQNSSKQDTLLVSRSWLVQTSGKREKA